MKGVLSLSAVMLYSLTALLVPGKPCAAGGGGDNSRTVPFQAVIKTPSGQPVNAPVIVTFRLYDTVAGGTPLWSETKALMSSNGIISTLLGNATPLPLPLDANRFVGIQVNSDPEMTPRVPLGAAPFALALPGLTTNEQGGIGIGTGNAFGLLDVVSSRPIHAGEYLDQVSSGDVDSTQLLNGETIWQSFRAGYTGQLTKIYIKTEASGTPSFFTFRVYEGTGVGGRLLFSKTPSLPSPDRGYYYVNVDVPVTAGYPYTFAITSATTNNLWIFYDRYNHYLHGSSAWPDGSPGMDLYFRTYVNTSQASLNHTLTVVSDRVGINTASPEGALCVQDPYGDWLQFRTEEGTPAWQLSGGQNLLLFQAGYTDIFALKPGPLVGIGTSSPAYPLDIYSLGQTVARLVSGSASWGSVLELRNNATSATLLGAINFNDTTGTVPGQIAYFKENSLTFRTAGNERMRIAANGNVGIGTAAPQYTLDVAGIIRANNVSPSDARLKTGITPLPEALDTVMALRGVTFSWDRSRFPEKNLPTGRQVGLIAQEVEKVLPEAVSTDPSGFKSLSYQSLVPVLIEAIKEQQKEIETLRGRAARVDELEERLSRLEAANGAAKR